MKQISFLIGFTFLLVSSFAQDSRTPKRVTFRLAITDNIQRVDYGYLAALADSGIVMLKSPVVFDHALANANTSVISYQNLSEVSIKRKGSVGRGILIGGLSGMFLGGVIGYISYKPTNCQDAIICFDFGPGTDAAAGASLGTVAGAAIGGIVGALAKKRFIIGGKRDKFQQMKESVIDMAYRKK
ncbi:MAG TPA: hypothetical protein VEV87_10855 [Chitinophagaceae bacterium]|nr:hypothetical protein [Chitinophagaceae bacterium]